MGLFEVALGIAFECRKYSGIGKNDFEKM